MRQSTTDRDVGSQVPWVAIVATTVALAAIVGGLYAYRAISSDRAHDEIVIATGPDSGTYDALGHALARILEGQGVVNKVSVLSTEGSVANMALLASDRGAADIAFIQSDTPANDRVRLIAPLYQEVLHVLVAKGVAGEVETIDDLQGRRVSLGSPGSGTRQVAERVLEHFKIVVGKDLALGPTDSAQGLIDGSADAAFILTAIPSRLIETLGQRDAVRFLSLGDAQEDGNEADALALVFPSVRATTIPRSTYVRLPERPVSAIAVSALLVASSELPNELVSEITETLFDHRTGLGGLEGEELVVARRIRENYQPVHAVIPFHDGATTYYQREEPPFFVEYAEAMSLGLTLLVGTWSALFALRQWMRRLMKNRIDAYYLDVERQAADLSNLSLEELAEHRDALKEIHRRAFADLVAERLEANESFTIFQDFLRAELASVEARIAEHGRS